MEESERTTIFLKAVIHVIDEVFTRVAYLQDVFDVFAVDITYPSVCLELYLRHYERSLSDSSPLAKKKRTTFQMEIERVATIIDQENGLTPTEIREIKTKQDKQDKARHYSKQDKIEISNIEVKFS